MSVLGSINSTSTLFTLTSISGESLHKLRQAVNARWADHVRRHRDHCHPLVAVGWQIRFGFHLFPKLHRFHVAAPAGEPFFCWPSSWKRATHRRVVAVCVGLPFCLALEFFAFPLLHYKIPFIYISFAGWILSILVMTWVSLLDQPPDYEQIKEFERDRAQRSETMAGCVRGISACGSGIPYLRSSGLA